MKKRFDVSRWDKGYLWACVKLVMFGIVIALCVFFLIVMGPEKRNPDQWWEDGHSYAVITRDDQKLLMVDGDIAATITRVIQDNDKITYVAVARNTKQQVTRYTRYLSEGGTAND